ncbi:MAG: extracellular solute-binding protein [Armatimonadetes bacterium]|nr:extracellular solute-binding protein [Armatimonadota bacterium]
MKKRFTFLALMALVCAGCSGAGGGASSGSSTETGSSPAVKVTEAPTGDGKIEGKLEIVAFKGGYGDDFYRTAAEEFAKDHPGLTATVEGDPQIWEKVRPRMVAGDTPDIMFPGWGMDQWGLVQDGQLMALDKALDSPAYDSQKTWRETFDPNLLKFCQKDGKTYMLPLYTMVYGWWYDPAVFAKNGWTPPTTYAELLSLCEKIKAKGVAPIAFQGKYPYYMIEGMLLPWAASIGGVEAVTAAQNLAPGAWKSEPMLKAAQMIAELRDKGYFLEGCVGMSHTESQTQFLNGTAAMVPCGSWIESEMRNVMPAGVTVRYFKCPNVTDGKGDPTAVLIGIEPWMIPVKAKNPNAAVGYYKYMTSLKKAKQFVEEKGTLMSIIGSDEAKMPETLKAPAAAVKGAKTLWAVQYRQWYPAFQKEVEGAITSMLNKEITPEQFCERCNAAAEKTREDESVPKYRVQ